MFFENFIHVFADVSAPAQPDLIPIFEKIFTPVSWMILIGVVLYCLVDIFIEWLKVKSKKGKKYE